MKKLFAMSFMILTCGLTYALPLGNSSEASLFLDGAFWEGSCCDPCDPCFIWLDTWSVRLGFAGDYVFNRHMEKYNDGDCAYDIENTTLNTNAGYLVLNICDRVDLFGRLGASCSGKCEHVGI